MPRALLPVVCLLLGVVAGALAVHLARDPAGPPATLPPATLPLATVPLAPVPSLPEALSLPDAARPEPEPVPPVWIQGEGWSKAWARAVARGVPVLAIVADARSVVHNDDIDLSDPFVPTATPPTRRNLWQWFVRCDAIDLLAWVEVAVVETKVLAAFAIAPEGAGDAFAVVVHTDGRDDAVRTVWWSTRHDKAEVELSQGRRRVDGSPSKGIEFRRFPGALEAILVEAIARDAGERDTLARANRAKADPERFAAWVRSARQRVALDPSVVFRFAPALAAALQAEPAALDVLFTAIRAEAGRRWRVGHFDGQILALRGRRPPETPVTQGPPSPEWCGTGRR